MNCPNCGFDPDPNSVIQDSLATTVSSPNSSEAPDPTFAMALRGAIFGEIVRYGFDSWIDVCAKLTASTFNALLVADEDAYAEYNKTVAEIPQEFAYWTLEGLVLDDIDRRAQIEEVHLGQAAEAFGHGSGDSEYLEELKAQNIEKARFRVTQAAKEVSDEFAAHEEFEQLSSTITVAVTIGFAASELAATLVDLGAVLYAMVGALSGGADVPPERGLERGYGFLGIGAKEATGTGKQGQKPS